MMLRSPSYHTNITLSADCSRWYDCAQLLDPCALLLEGKCLADYQACRSSLELSDTCLGYFADALCDYAQPLAPCALSLEGTVLGASQITWVGGRTVLSAAAALGFFSFVSSQGWGLPGVWAVMVLLVICNALLDAWLLLSKHSPIAIKEAAL
jgi:hypothetical protein